MKRIVTCLLFATGLVSFAQAQNQPQTPYITGIAHIAYYVTNLDTARAYYEGFLGFDQAFAVKNAQGQDEAAFIKINDHQYIELVTGPAKNHGFMDNAGFITTNAEALREHLAQVGIKVPDKVTKDAAGNLSFEVTDPSGFTLQIVQYMPHSLTARTKGKDMPASRISTKIDHIGLLENNREAAWKFYSDAFGFVKDGNGTKMTIPGTEARFEIGFERKPPTIARYHVKDHICLSVPDVPKVTAELLAKPAAKQFPDAIKDTHQLGNGKHVAEIYGPDGNRVELMEPLQD